ncbi:unnamed protein product [Trifolium pratense]|uniref:Uncharacterized protein n=1 Tax=Trifolium pratense TaxID=57577 RepID=A0ACB0LF51_TRIPR|nr:unnamed protein product [Trifolium pratense]
MADLADKDMKQFNTLFNEVSPLPFKVIEKVLKDNLRPDFSKILFSIARPRPSQFKPSQRSCSPSVCSFFSALWFIQHRGGDLVYGLHSFAWLLLVLCIKDDIVKWTRKLKNHYAWFRHEHRGEGEILYMMNL